MRDGRTQRRSVLIGGALMLGIAAAALLVFFAPAISRWLRPSIDVVALLDDAAGLAGESPVWIAGRPVGQVIAVEVRDARFGSSERVAVRMRLPREHAAHVRKDSEVRVTSRRLIGEPVIDILPGSASAPAIQHGDSLRQRPGGSWRGLLARAEALNASFALFFEEVDAFKPRAEARKDDLQRIDRQLTASMAGLRELFAALESSPVSTLSGPELQRLLDRLSATGRQLGAAFRKAADSARAAQHDAQPSLRALAARADTITGILAGIQTTIAASGGGFLVRAQTDSAITKGIHRAREQLDSLMAETKRNPFRFWF